MKLVALLLALAVVGMFVAYQRNSGATPRPEAVFHVTFDDAQITLTAPMGETGSVRWEELTRVAIRTTDDGPYEPDVFWGFHAGDQSAKLVFPGGATGEQELLAELQKRLSGFRDDEVVRAMGSTSNALFVVWEGNSNVAMTGRGDR